LFASFLSSVAHAGVPGHLWSHHFGTTLQDYPSAVAIDAAHNVFMCGSYSGTINFGGGALTSSGSFSIFLAKFDANGNYLWAKSYSGSTANAQAVALALDTSGNPVMGGTYTSTVNLGGPLVNNNGGTDIFLAKYANADGANQWALGYGSTGNESMNSLTVDALSNIIVGGQISGSNLNLGGGTITTSGQDGYIAKYGPTGVFQWQKVYGSVSSDGVFSVAADAGNNIYATGMYAGSVDFGGGPLVSYGASDMFLLKLDTTGAHVWSKHYGAANTEWGNGIALNSAGTGIFVSGLFSTSTDLGGGTVSSYGSQDGFVARYDANGNYVWGHHYGGTSGTDNVLYLSVGGNGDIAFTGVFTGTAHFGGLDLIATGTDTFVARADANGNVTGVRGFVDSSNGDAPRGIASDATGNFATVGFFGPGTADVGGGIQTSAGSTDTYVALYSPDNEAPRITSIADIGNDQGRLVKVRFTRSVHDGDLSPSTATSYEVYRKDAAAPSVVSAAAPRRELLAKGWTFVGETPAHGDTEYGLDVPTIGDSTIALGGYNSTFLVRAATAASLTYYESDPDSGYSVDNLAPGIPGMFAFAANNLTWNESTAKDFDYFSVYGSNVDNFANATLVNYTIGTNMNVSASPYAYYYVTATDFSGNEGKPAKVHAATGVGDTPSSYILSVSNYPNPFNPRTTVKYTIPGHARVSVRVFDASGALVATLFDGERAAGAYSVEWDGRGANGLALSSGVYFARVSSNGETRTKKMVLLK
jgi:hypothetical protein